MIINQVLDKGVVTYTITSSAGSNGTISPLGTTTVVEGGSQRYDITPNSGYAVDDVLIDGTISAGAVTSYTFNDVTANHTISVTFRVATYGSFYIDKTELATSPTTCVYYNDGMTQTQAKTIVWEWLNPSVVKDGTVQYFLDKSDLSKKLDGTASNLDGTDGDVMVSIKPLWWKVITNDTSKLEIKVSNGEFDGAVTAHTFNGTTRKYLHVGMFHMSGSAAKSVYSTTATPWVSQTNDAFRTAAEAIGDTYCTMTYRTWTLLEILTVFASGSCDSQTTCGQDYVGGSSAVAVGTSAMLTANGWTESTKTSSTTSLMWMFFSQLWGNVLDFISGMKSYSGNMGIATDQYTARGVTVSGSIPSTWTTYSLNSTILSNYMSEAQGVSDYPFAGKTCSGSSSTYYCDYWYSHKSNNYCAYVGGHYDFGAYAGVFYCRVSFSASAASDYIGARLQCLDVDNA